MREGKGEQETGTPASLWGEVGWFFKWGEGGDMLGWKGGLGGLPTPWWCCVWGTVPSFCSWSLRSGNWSVAFLYLIEHNYFGSAVKRKKKICFQCRNCRRARFDPWWGRSFEGELGNPLRDSCLENPMDGGAWRATVHGVAKSWTQLKWLSMHVARTEN